jgi:hypothetical protein
LFSTRFAEYYLKRQKKNCQKKAIGELTALHLINGSIIGKVQVSLGGDEETSLLTQIQKLRVEQNKSLRENNKVSVRIDETFK